jgi:hypothetical protein
MDLSKLVLDEKKVKRMPTTELRWFIQIGQAGLKGPWKNNPHVPKVREFLKQLKSELKTRTK